MSAYWCVSVEVDFYQIYRNIIE